MEIPTLVKILVLLVVLQSDEDSSTVSQRQNHLQTLVNHNAVISYQKIMS